LIWASLVSLAQVYVGVHYPSDVLAGAMLGSLIGYGWGKLFNKYYSLV
jgi:undecaprenyl-diphosphatase